MQTQALEGALADAFPKQPAIAHKRAGAKMGSTMSRVKVTDEQLRALRYVAGEHGLQWRGSLAQMWSVRESNYWGMETCKHQDQLNSLRRMVERDGLGIGTAVDADDAEKMALAWLRRIKVESPLDPRY